MGIDLFYCGINAIILTKSKWSEENQKAFRFLSSFHLFIFSFLVEIFALIVGEIIKVK